MTRHILIVEDSYLVAEAIGDLVRRHGYEVGAVAGHLHRALKIIEDSHFDGAIVDLDLHGHSGIPVCAALQQKNIPYFFLTGYLSSHNVPPELREAEWLTKPLDPEEFTAALSVFDSSHRRPEKARSQSGNRVLDKLSANDWETIKPNFQRVILQSGQILERPREEPKNLYFPISAVTTVVARAHNGKHIELGMIGREGVVGTGAVLGNAMPATETIVRFTGTAWHSDLSDGVFPSGTNRILADYVLSYLHSFQTQCAETTLFTGHATIEHRLARWLLIASGRCQTLKLTITQDAIADALAVRRAGVTQALHVLEARHLVKTERKSITIIDRARLSHEVEALYLTPLGRAPQVQTARTQLSRKRQAA